MNNDILYIMDTVSSATTFLFNITFEKGISTWDQVLTALNLITIIQFTFNLYIINSLKKLCTPIVDINGLFQEKH